MIAAFLLLILALPNNPIDAIRAGSPVTRLTVGTYTLSETLSLPSNVTVICDKGAVIEAGPGPWGVHSPVVLIPGSNVTIVGCAIKGRRDDWSKPPFEPSEWRHAIELVGAINVKLIDVTVSESGGDGVAIDPLITGMFSEDRKPCKDVQIDRLKSVGNYRTGMSITSCVNCTVRDSEFADTKGVATNSAIDVEPSHGGDLTQNILIERCKATNNAASGFLVQMINVDQHSKPISITFRDCWGEKIPVSHALIRIENWGWNLNAEKPIGFVKWDETIWKNPE